MHTNTPTRSGFKRQVVFRLGPDDWPLLEQAAAEHGSIQAAVLAGLRALGASHAPEGQAAPAATESGVADAVLLEPPADPEEEITARQAAELLGLQPNTVRGYIRSGRLPGRYEGAPSWIGWVTTRAAVSAYRR